MSSRLNCLWRPILKEPRLISAHSLHFLETRIIGLDLSSFKFFWWAAKNYFISTRVTFRPFKVIQGHRCWCQSKVRVRTFLLVRHSINLGPILHRFGDFTVFMCSWPHPIPPQFWGVPVAPDRPCWVSKRISLKLFGGEIIFQVFPTYVISNSWTYCT